MRGPIKAIVTYIEGTTSSLSFVKDVLFPYARERRAEFVRAHGSNPAVRKLLDEAGGRTDDGKIIAKLIHTGKGAGLDITVFTSRP